MLYTVYLYSVLMRHPIQLSAVALPLTLFESAVNCGFPSPAADHAQRRIDLNDHLLLNREASYLFRVNSDSMTGIGIFDGDTIIVDRSIEARHNHIVLAILDDEYTVKRLYQKAGKIMLIAENSAYPPINFNYGQELRIWGVVTFNLRRILHC
jgi:DNA polymerase V